MNARRKGAKGERRAAEFLKEWSGLEFRRSPQSGGLRGHVADYTEGDIVCVEKNYIFPFCVEVKSYEELNFNHLLYDVKSKIKGFWKQTIEAATRAEKVPILLMRYNGLPPTFFFVVISYRFQRYLQVNFKRQLVYNNKFIITTTKSLSRLPYELVEKSAKVFLGIN